MSAFAVSNKFMTRLSIVRIIAAVIAACGLALVMVSVNTHGDRAQRAVLSVIREQSERVKEQRARERAEEVRVTSGGLNLVDMFECMCGEPLGTDLRGWIGLWLVTVLVGGVPTAIILRKHLGTPAPRHPGTPAPRHPGT
ncbi:MAG: hypothetical protein K2Y23_27160 [Cyanobacteria bacterium]|nr:hypothetical protein [Cyanobacteriota bacterium]